MTRCTRCNRQLKAPTPTGMGAKCALAVLGRKEKRQAGEPVKRDERTADMFGEAALRGDDE